MKLFLRQNKQPAQMQVKSIMFASSTHLCCWPDLGIIYWLKMESIDPEAHLNPDSSDYRLLSAHANLRLGKTLSLHERAKAVNLIKDADEHLRIWPNAPRYAKIQSAVSSKDVHVWMQSLLLLCITGFQYKHMELFSCHLLNSTDSEHYSCFYSKMM